MAGQASKMDLDRWVEIQSALTRALRGESVSVDDVCLPEPEFKCPTCKDTAFVVETAFDGTVSGRRCQECRRRVDAETRKNAKYVVPDDAIPDTPAPEDFDWKQAAGFDKEEP